MTNDEPLTSLAEQLAVLAEGVEALIDHQRSLAEKIDEQAASLAAIGTAVGLTYLATDAERPLPVDVLEDRAFARFLDLYPIDGPPIIGQARMDEHMARLDKIDPARLAAGFRDLARQTNLSAVECVRNKQIEHRARAKHGDLDALEQRREWDH